MNRVREIVESMSPARRAEWMAERKRIVQARKEIEEEVERMIEMEVEQKRKEKLCSEIHNKPICRSCGRWKVEPVTIQNTGWYVADKYNEMHRQR
jgi:hypothetical protein